MGLFCVLKTLPPHTVGARSQNDETEGETRWTSIIALFGLCLQWLARPLSALPPDIAEQVHEIRLRVGCGVQLTIGGKPCCPAELPALQTLRLTPLQMEEIFVTLCGGSVHSHETEIAAGYVTLSCGCRAGLAGRVLLRTGAERRLAGAALGEYPRCPEPRISSATETPGYSAAAIYRDAPDGGTRQRQNDPSARCRPGTCKTKQGRGRHRRAEERYSPRRKARRFRSTSSAAYPRDRRCRWLCAPSRRRSSCWTSWAGMDELLCAGAGAFQRGGIYRHTSCRQLGRSCPPSAGAVSAKVRCAPCGSASERPHCAGAAERGACFVKRFESSVRCSGWAAAGAQEMRPARIRGSIWRRWKRRFLLLQRVRQEISYRHTDLTLLFRRLKQEGLVTGESFRSLCPLPGLTRPERDCFIECFSGLAAQRQSRSASSWHFIRSGSRCFAAGAGTRPPASWN